LERTKRVDAEFYQKENLTIDGLLRGLRHESIANVAYVSDGNHFAISDSFQDDGVPYYRGQDITNQFFVEQSTPIFIDEQTFNENHMIRSHLKKNDVLLSIVGTVGSVALFSQEINATCSCKIAILRPKQIVPEYFATFLSSKFGQNQIKKFVRGAVQTGFLLEDTDQINVVLFSSYFQREIENSVKQAHAKLEESKALYAEAENLLLNELGLRSFAPSTENTVVKSFRESFLQTGRLDAEYYQPKYDELSKLIIEATQRKGWTLETLGNLSEPLRYGSSAKLEYLAEGVPFLRIADVGNYRFDRETLKYISAADAEVEKHASVKKGDVIISRSGTLGLSVAIPSELEGAIFGSYFIRIRPNEKVDPDFLALYMNARVGQMQVEQLNTGGIQTNLTVPAMESLKISLPPKDIQGKFVAKVKGSFATQDQSKIFLKTAKRAVEIAIEEDERAALEWMKQVEIGLIEAG
jgi:restriction endonuclease S subunit